MNADLTQLDRLSSLLWKKGVAAFCPTTVSTSSADLLYSLEVLGKWIHRGNHPGAIPLGIHLEGPFIAEGACGAHPSKYLRPFRWSDFDAYWKASRGTLKIITLAPERIQNGDLEKLSLFANAHSLRLSLGHSCASQSECEDAFLRGFSGVTHAWNALRFHHREPGAMGAALGNPRVYLELIADLVHLSPRVLDWTLGIHPNEKICFVSDCVPAAQLRTGKKTQFGPLWISEKDGACRLADGSLAGGSLLLPQAFSNWVENTAQRFRLNPWDLAKRALPLINSNPLHYLGIPLNILKNRHVEWEN